MKNKNNIKKKKVCDIMTFLFVNVVSLFVLTSAVKEYKTSGSGFILFMIFIFGAFSIFILKISIVRRGKNV